MIDFIGKRKIGFSASGILVVVGALSFLLTKPAAKYGIDFSGGTMLHLKFGNQIETEDLEAIRSGLSKIGIKAGIQHIGEGKRELIVKVKGEEDEKVALKIREMVEERLGDFSWSSSYVGPSVSRNLRSSAIKCLFVGVICLLIYITVRFEFRFAVSAIIALIHDVLITLGIYTLSGREFNAPTIAAFLAIVGYSLNDTIVILDRIRENLKLMRREPYDVIINTSINQSLRRTIITSATTLFATIALLLFGTGEVADFAFAMTVGIIVGTYSSSFVASPILFEWHIRSRAK
jgi:preprotein translocase subunit SecF